MKRQLTHEQYIHAIRDIVAAQLDAEQADKLRSIKLVYGFGAPQLRGVTIYSRWVNGHGPDHPEPFVEICAAGEESYVQLAGTTVHELGHVMAGFEAGHSKAWKDTCARLGLNGVQAAGTQYTWEMFAPWLREGIEKLGEPTDGRPNNGAPTPRIGRRKGKVGPCTAGIGTRGGKSRGPGSGSRMRKYVCPACQQIIRAGTDTLEAIHKPCGDEFALVN